MKLFQIENCLMRFDGIDYLYDVKVWFIIPGHGFSYAGVGKRCRTIDEVSAYMAAMTAE